MADLIYGNHIDADWGYDRVVYVANLNNGFDSDTAMNAARQIPVTPAPVALSDSDFVTALYRHYYNRAPDTSGLAFWVNEITSNRKTRAGVEQAFTTSPDIIKTERPYDPQLLDHGNVALAPAATGSALPSTVSPLLLIGLGIGAYFLLKD